MKFSTNRETLAYALNLLTGTVQGPYTLPILSTVHLRVDSTRNLLIATTTNTQQRFVTSIPITDAEDGETCLPARHFQSIVSSFPSEIIKLQLSASHNEAKIAGSNARFSLLTSSPSEFPPAKNSKPEFEIILPNAEFFRAIKLVEGSRSTDSTQYILNSVNFVLDNSNDNTHLRLFATNRIVFSKMEIKCTGNRLPNEISIVIPSTAIDEIIRLSSKVLPDSPVRFLSFGNNVSFRFRVKGTSSNPTDIEYTTQLIDGKYQDVKPFLNRKVQLDVTVDSASFHENLSLVSLVSSTKSPEASLTISNRNIVLASESSEYGNARNSVELTKDLPENTKFTIKVNPKYLLKMVSPLTGDLTLSFDGDTPISVTSKSDPEFLGRIAPLRLQPASAVV